MYDGCVDVEKTWNDEVMERREEEGWRSVEEGKQRMGGWGDRGGRYRTITTLLDIIRDSASGQSH